MNHIFLWLMGNKSNSVECFFLYKLLKYFLECYILNIPIQINSTLLHPSKKKKKKLYIAKTLPMVTFLSLFFSLPHTRMLTFFLVCVCFKWLILLKLIPFLLHFFSRIRIWNLFSHLRQPNDPKNRKHFSIYDTFPWLKVFVYINYLKLQKL